MKHIVIRNVPDELRRRLDIEAAKAGLTLKRYVSEILAAQVQFSLTELEKKQS